MRKCISLTYPSTHDPVIAPMLVISLQFSLSLLRGSATFANEELLRIIIAFLVGTVCEFRNIPRAPGFARRYTATAMTFFLLVIPDYAKMHWIVRAPTWKEVEELRDRVINCFK